MKFSVDDEVILELSDDQLKVMAHGINSDILVDDLKRRVVWVISHKYENLLDGLLKDAMPVLAANNASLPTDKLAQAALVFALPDYQDKKNRDDAAIVASGKVPEPPVSAPVNANAKSAEG